MFEYEVIPAPRKGKKARGIKTSEDRFANAMSELLNEMAADGWEYLRTDTLPSEERSGLTGRTTVYQNMLVFRRALEVEEATEVEAAPAVDQPAEPAPALSSRRDDEMAEEHTAPSLPSAAQANEVRENAPTITREES